VYTPLHAHWTNPPLLQFKLIRWIPKYIRVRKIVAGVVVVLFVLLFANDGVCDDYFKMLHLGTLSVAEFVQGVASVMDGWLDHWMLERMNEWMTERIN